MTTKRKSRVYKLFEKDSIETLKICLDQQLKILDNAVLEYKYKQIKLTEVKRLERHYMMIKEILENKMAEVVK